MRKTRKERPNPPCSSRLSDKLRHGASLPRGHWSVDPRPRVVPAQKGRHAPYRRTARRRASAAASREASDV
ncbi:MAG: hypothetical protein C7B46_18190 [Sulfobacillus benefaciens]|uniref:Uncharacterized protein n=1 Tax=Sulfobacillus benefaciens TaxID=453960 RepID=A0A2T2X6N3_9FIRM|nr:MAG: hypothetical protein C7B46_18190 [Sulfobacillus benefaciens]